jgi:hypothetical protein
MPTRQASFDAISQLNSSFIQQEAGKSPSLSSGHIQRSMSFSNPSFLSRPSSGHFDDSLLQNMNHALLQQQQQQSQAHAANNQQRQSSLVQGSPSFQSSIPSFVDQQNENNSSTLSMLLASHPQRLRVDTLTQQHDSLHLPSPHPMSAPSTTGNFIQQGRYGFGNPAPLPSPDEFTHDNNPQSNPLSRSLKEKSLLRSKPPRINTSVHPYNTAPQQFQFIDYSVKSSFTPEDRTHSTPLLSPLYPPRTADSITHYFAKFSTADDQQHSSQTQ